MSDTNKKSDAEEILAEFQKAQEGVEEAVAEPEAVAEQKLNSEKEEQTYKTRDVIFIGSKPIMTYVTATLTQLASLPMVTITARGKRITQAIDVSQMIVKRMDEVGFVVKYIDDNGFISLNKLGGIPERVLTGQKILILRGVKNMSISTFCTFSF